MMLQTKLAYASSPSLSAPIMGNNLKKLVGCNQRDKTKKLRALATDRLVLTSSRSELAFSNSRRKVASNVERKSAIVCAGGCGSSPVG